MINTLSDYDRESGAYVAYLHLEMANPRVTDDNPNGHPEWHMAITPNEEFSLEYLEYIQEMIKEEGPVVRMWVEVLFGKENPDGSITVRVGNGYSMRPHPYTDKEVSA